MTIAFTPIRVIEATVATDTNVYADADQIGVVNTLAGAFEIGQKYGEVVSLTVVDKASQSSALTVYLFDESPTVASSDNAALNISDAEMADKCIGKIEVAASDYQALSASSLATVLNVGLALKSAGQDLYAVVQSQGTPTYTGVTDLVLKLGLRRG